MSPIYTSDPARVAQGNNYAETKARAFLQLLDDLKAQNATIDSRIKKMETAPLKTYRTMALIAGVAALAALFFKTR